MTDNTEEEALSHPSSTHPENPSEEIISTKDTEIINSNQEIVPMEVHKHPHHVTHKKKWPEYLLEFCMLFLAVFLGFVAENIRENSAERHREKEYMQSLLNDLRSDTIKLKTNIAIYKKRLLNQDTLLAIYPLLDKGFNAVFYRNLISIQGYPDFIYSDATIQQLKNSGGFRLLRNHDAVRNIMAYDAVVKKALLNESNENHRLQQMDDYTSELFDGQALNYQIQKGRSLEEIEAEKMDWLFSHDRVVMSKFYNKLANYRDLFSTLMANMEDVKAAAVVLMGYLQKEYNLD
jgi:hypothetical protein